MCSYNERAVAETFVHEVGHNLGCHGHNKNLCTIEHLYKDFFDKEFSNDKPIPLKDVKLKEIKDVKLVRYERALANLERAQSRFTRSKTIFQKWLGKVKRYESILPVGAIKQRKQ